MKISKIPGFGNYGQYIDGCDFTNITDEEWLEIGKSHLKSLLTVFRNSIGLTNDQFYTRIAQLGPTKGNVRAHFARKYGRVIDALKPEDLAILSEEDRKFLLTRSGFLEKTEGGHYLTRIYGVKDKDGNMLGAFDSGDLGWHCNEGSVLNFGPEVALYGSDSMLGSATGFMQTADYYESISDSFRKELDEMIIVHGYKPGYVNKTELENPEFAHILKLNMVPEEDSETPMVMTSPGGIRGLHYAVQSAKKIKGMSQEESDKMFARLDKELFTEQYQYFHYYQNDRDMLLFDNSITLHNRIGGLPERKAFRIQYEPSNLYETPWRPYDSDEVYAKYLALCKERDDILNS